MAVTGKSNNGPAVRRPPPYQRSFSGAFGAPIDLKAQVAQAPYPACALLCFATGAGVINVRGEDGIASQIPVGAGTAPVLVPGGFSEITSITTATGVIIQAFWASSST